MNVLVVPTNRPESIGMFLSAWSPWPWERIILVVDDAEVPLPVADICRDDERLEAHAWADIDTALDQSGVISRGDSAIRSFGFWRAWSSGADVIFTLDDDCYPAEGVSPDEFVGAHLRNLHETPAWQSTVAGLHVRGLPYRNLGTLGGIALSVGLWVGNADLDAVQTLAGTPNPDDQASLVSRVMPPSQYFPMSGMNLAFPRETACVMYFAPMGMEQPYRRFDDIWCGLVVQRICGHLRHAIVCGHPVVHHRRASDPFVNLVKEAAGIGRNERMWETIHAVVLTGTSPLECMNEMGEQLLEDDDGYVRRWGRAIVAWCGFFAGG
jgi:reversibly glycosylated polypeptide / UDP-arabinopyranose mutase